MSAVVKELDELGIARAIRDGTLSSPQQYANLLLVALRITGTGSAYRSGINESVWRDPSIYLNAEFLERCQGLPVVLEHPEDRAVLNSAEFTDRIVGTIALPYVKGNEVWGVAKIYDAATAQMLLERKLSTSPSVVLGGADDRKIGSLLIEGKPLLLDHLAIVVRGVWDKGGPPTGVESHADTATQELNMAALKAQLADIARRAPATMNDSATADIVVADGARYYELRQLLGKARADTAAPSLLSGESLLDYRCRLAGEFKSYSTSYKDSDLYAVGAADGAVMNMVLESIYNDAEKVLKAPTGPLRSAVTTMESGHRVRTWYGDSRETWAPFAAPAQFGYINRNVGPK